MTPQPGSNRRFAALLAAVAAFSLVSQYVLLIGPAPLADSALFRTARFFSCFTVPSNLLVVADRWRGRARGTVVAT